MDVSQKYIEHWIVWVFIDGYSAYLYAEKGLWPTMVLFVVYLVIATVGYLNWNKELKEK